MLPTSTRDAQPQSQQRAQEHTSAVMRALLNDQDPIEPAKKRLRWLRKRWVLGPIIAVAIILALFGASFVVTAQTLGRIIPGQTLIDEGIAIAKPGAASSVGERVEIASLPTFEANGEILFTTVSIDLEVTVIDWLAGEVDSNAELIPLKDILGDQTVSENRTRNMELMGNSKDDAITAALEYLGVPVTEAGVSFNLVLADGPADGLLNAGEIIVGIDGASVSSIDELRHELSQKEPETQGIVTIEAEDGTTSRDVELTWDAHPDGIDGAFIGVGEIAPHYHIPNEFLDIEIDTGATGGPSAGLAFTLAIIDLLTEGELTGNTRVAVTGQIFVGRDVGNVGGIPQKAEAARSAQADAFIVPAEQLEVAETHAEDMPVYGVATLEEAIEVLGRLGGEIDNLALAP